MVNLRVTKVPYLKNAFEKEAWANGRLVCGIDEVGRGCLSGPVVTAAVIIPSTFSYEQIALIKDSKIMTSLARKKAYALIKKHCLIGVSVVSHRIIDTCNIRNATIIAMKKAAIQLLFIAPCKPMALLVDALPLDMTNTAYHDVPVYSAIKGEQWSVSIAAASIVAKEVRDSLMEKMDQLFPGYGMAKHKGYSTLEHKKAVKSKGPSLVHRSLFVNTVLSELAYEKQLLLC